MLAEMTVSQILYYTGTGRAAVGPLHEIARVTDEQAEQQAELCRAAMARLKKERPDHAGNFDLMNDVHPMMAKIAMERQNNG